MEEVKCIICEKLSDNKVILFSAKTFQKCKDILVARKKFSLKFSEIVFPSERNEIIGYHSQCYKDFTALQKKYKKEYELYEASMQPSTSKECSLNDVEGESLHSHVILEASSFVTEDTYHVNESLEQPDETTKIECTNDAEICFFCKKNRKTVKGRTQKLTCPQSNAWLEKIENKAAEVNDIKKLEEIASASYKCKYHHACKLAYVTQCRQICQREKPPTVWHRKRDYHSIAFENICNYVSLNIIENEEYLFYDFIRSKYIDFLNEQYSTINDESDIPNFFSTQHLQEKLLKLFKGQIQIVKVQNKKVIVPFGYTIIDNVDIINM